ncbi:MAG TPA: hypothetical protein H9706_00670, partial [Candidatus Gemmiger stercorigallinarum]|nr:hypothetical protein [Candidatus Gemmiger stercorigallinarum]
MNQAIRKLSGLLVLPVLLAALLMMPVRAHAAEASYECYAELPVSVALNGDNDEQFHVMIEPAEGMGDAVPMPEEAVDGLMIAGDASDTFSNFHFTEPGDYVYVVKQEIGSTAYMSYDNTVYTVTIRVTNADNGGLQSEIWAVTDDNPTVKVRALSFLNTYAPPAPSTPKPDDHPDIAEGIANGTWGGAPTATPGAVNLNALLPQTSDDLPLTALVVVLVLAAAAIVVLVVLRVRKNKQDGQK